MLKSNAMFLKRFQGHKWLPSVKWLSSVSQSLKEDWRQRFTENNIENPLGSVREITKFARKNAFQEKNVDAIFSSLCTRRLNREPLQYIIEEWDFRLMTLSMKKPVFIPRPETEGLIDIVKPYLKKNSKFLEVGCGSGAISLAFLTELSTVRCMTLDKNQDAVSLTQENAQKLGVADRINVLHKTFDELTLLDVGGEKFDMLISNPPYIPHKEMAFLQEEVKIYEHHDALDGGYDGLEVIRSILRSAHKFVCAKGYVWLEVDVSHPSMIEEFVLSNPSIGLKFVLTFNDCYNRPRFCQLQCAS
ncbi:MTRF1L release factor glutamine methyltransferase isoform X3 [Hydra vulgaris]|uniref:peptide chain release factor N(5)-glutamine methyltransferase n=1 Tax=Hydra vulgaris TaxID=6087 RepID=A0ABM4DFL9_HYDVU